MDTDLNACPHGYQSCARCDAAAAAEDAAYQARVVNNIAVRKAVQDLCPVLPPDFVGRAGFAYNTATDSQMLCLVLTWHKHSIQKWGQLEGTPWDPRQSAYYGDLWQGLMVSMLRQFRDAYGLLNVAKETYAQR